VIGDVHGLLRRPWTQLLERMGYSVAGWRRQTPDRKALFLVYFIGPRPLIR